MDREGSATAIEPLVIDPPGAARLDFAAGIAVGLVVAAIAAQIWVARAITVLDRWRDLGPGGTKNLTRLAVSPGWSWGAPAATAVLLGGLLALGARRARWYVVLAALAVAAFVLTYLWATAPLGDIIRGIPARAPG